MRSGACGAPELRSGAVKHNPSLSAIFSFHEKRGNLLQQIAAKIFEEKF